MDVVVVFSLAAKKKSGLVSGGGGLGEMMFRSYRYGDVRTAFATQVTISLIGAALYKLAQWLRGQRFHRVASAIGLSRRPDDKRMIRTVPAKARTGSP